LGKNKDMDVIVTTPDQLRQIVSECLDNHKTTPAPAPQPEAKFLYSIVQLAEFLDCSPVTAQKLKNSGKIRYKQFGRKCVFNSLEILEDLNHKRRG
jgi:hypothetical protein